MVFQSFNLFENLNVLENAIVAQTTVLKRDRKEAESIAKANLEKVSDVMLKTADGHTGYLQGTPFGNKADHETYVKASKEYGSLRERRDAILGEQARRIHERTAAEPLKPRTFVNSYGEATKRSVTTSGYEQAQKRQQKAVLRNMGY